MMIYTYFDYKIIPRMQKLKLRKNLYIFAFNIFFINFKIIHFN